MDCQVVDPLIPVGHPNPLDCFIDPDNTGIDIEIFPLKTADFTDAKARMKAYQDSEVAEGEVPLEIVQEDLLVGR